jgi:heat shock protein HslJ
MVPFSMEKFFSGLFLGLGFIACMTPKNSFQDGLKGSWQLTVFPTTDKTFDELFGQRRPQIQFDLSRKTVTGTTGCNHLKGTYQISNDELSFTNPFITTKMACPGYEESIFLDAFNKVNRFDIHRDELRLWHDSILVMTFVRK